MRKSILTCFFTFVSALAFSQCFNTNYGSGVTCIGGAGNGGLHTNQTSNSVNYSPAAGHAIIATAYQCWDSNCATTGKTTLSISDNLRNPETCFSASPHSPFTLVETSFGAQHLQQYMWVCPSIPSGVKSFTATCSMPKSCNYITLTVTEWKGLATSNPFDTDGGAASTVRGTTATVSTKSATGFTNDLRYTFFDTTGDDSSCAVSPYVTALQFFSGNINTARQAAAAGRTETAQVTWSSACPVGNNKNDDWYGTIATIKTAVSKPIVAPPTGLSVVVN